MTITENYQKSMLEALEEIKAILKLVHQDKLEQARSSLLKDGSVKKQIYELCDGTRTTAEIASALQKETGYVSSYITILRREGLIKTIDRANRQVHEQVF